MDSLSRVWSQNYRHEALHLPNVHYVSVSLWSADMNTPPSVSFIPAGFPYALSTTHPEAEGAGPSYERRRLIQDLSTTCVCRFGHPTHYPFGHVARLGGRVQAPSALRLAVDIHSGAAPSQIWRRPRGRSRCKLLGSFPRGMTFPLYAPWSDAVSRGRCSIAQISMKMKTEMWFI